MLQKSNTNIITTAITMTFNLDTFSSFFRKYSAIHFRRRTFATLENYFTFFLSSLYFYWCYSYYYNDYLISFILSAWSEIFWDDRERYGVSSFNLWTKKLSYCHRCSAIDLISEMRSHHCFGVAHCSFFFSPSIVNILCVHCTLHLSTIRWPCKLCENEFNC